MMTTQLIQSTNYLVHHGRPALKVEILMEREEVVALENLLQDLRPGTSVEIGSLKGGSSLVIADYSERLFCVDPWINYSETAGFQEEVILHYDCERHNVFAAFCENTKEFLFKTIFPCRGPSTLWASVWTQPIDFLFIDGCHDYEAVKADITAWFPHVKPGGIILGHDYLEKSFGAAGYLWEFPGVAQAVRESFEDYLVIPGTKFWMVAK